MLILAIKCQGTPNLFQISPKIMHWHKQIWLVDLTPCLSYWQTISQRDDIIPWIKDMLPSICGDDVQSYHHHHPWLAILGLKSESYDPFLISWDLWRETAEEYVAIKPAASVHDKQTFRRDLERMQRMVSRLTLKNPAELRTAHPTAIRTRFGSILEQLWEWTFIDIRSQFFTTGFPWVGMKDEEPPHISRHLEQPIQTWDDIAPWLTEDLDFLCNLINHKVLTLTWDLLLYDLTTKSVEINFRHPHHLHREKGHHKTALAQALYSYERTAHAAHTDYPASTLITGWNLKMTHGIATTPWSHLYFDDQDAIAQTSLLALENRVKVPLEHYQMTADWTPEDSYRTTDQKTVPKATPSLLITAKERPLYLYQTPQPVSGQLLVKKTAFTERTMRKWWNEEPTDLTRDYYQVIDHKKRHLWAYREKAGTWVIQGLFG